MAALVEWFLLRMCISHGNTGNTEKSMKKLQSLRKLKKKIETEIEKECIHNERQTRINSFTTS